MPPKIPKPQRILVTGAYGCVGSLVVDELLARGHRVVACDRPGAPRPSFKDGSVEIREADIRDETVVRALCVGVDGVINTAAIVDIAKSFEELAPVNLDAVRHLYSAARANEHRAFVHFSTGSVYAPSWDGRPYDERSAVTSGNAYVRTKLLSEDWLRSRPAGGPRVAMLRPSLIFGPRGRVLAAALAAVPAIFGKVSTRALPLRGGPRSNWVHAIDVARAAVFLFENDSPPGEVYNVASDEVLTIGDLMSMALRIAGLDVKGPRLPYPTPIVRAIAPLLDREGIFKTVNRASAELWSRIQDEHALARELIPRIDREALPYAFRDSIFSNEKLARLGFELRYKDFASGWTDTMRWYEAAQWVPARAGRLPGTLVQQSLPTSTKEASS